MPGKGLQQETEENDLMASEEMDIIASAVITLGAIIIYAIIDLWRARNGR